MPAQTLNSPPPPPRRPSMDSPRAALERANVLLEVGRNDGGAEAMTLAAAQSPFVCDHVAQALADAGDELQHLNKLASEYVVAVLNGVLQASAAGVIMKAQMSAARVAR